MHRAVAGQRRVHKDTFGGELIDFDDVARIAHVQQAQIAVSVKNPRGSQGASLVGFHDLAGGASDRGELAAQGDDPPPQGILTGPVEGMGANRKIMPLPKAP